MAKAGGKKIHSQNAPTLRAYAVAQDCNVANGQESSAFYRSTAEYQAEAGKAIEAAADGTTTSLWLDKSFRGKRWAEGKGSLVHAEQENSGTVSIEKRSSDSGTHLGCPF